MAMGSQRGRMDDALPNRPFARRFRAVRLLNQGRGMTTYLGDDMLAGDALIKTVAVKTVRPTERVRLDFETAVLNREDDAGGIVVGNDEVVLFYARPFLPGRSLEVRLAEGRLDPRDVVRLGAAALSTLARIHPHGVLHRGMKPSNVIIPEDGVERARLVDFGFNRSSRVAAPDDPSSLRDAQYLSPEHAGALDVPMDARADLYALGVTLYEAVAGVPPFTGETVGELLRKHMTARPMPLSAVAPDAPAGLELVIDRLLRKDPRDRYQTAAGALADFEQLKSGDREEIVVGAADLRGTLCEPALVGRTEELATLERAVVRARNGEGGVVLVEGESGRGKTRLLSELSWRAASLGARVLKGNGVDREAEGPYHALVGVARELVSMAQADPDWARRIAARLGPHSAAVRASIPELSAIVPGDRYASLGPEVHGEERTTAALTAFLDALGTADAPMTLLLDDAQWIDESTMHLVEQWQRRSAGHRHVLVILAYRPEEVAADHPLRSLESMHHLRLAELSPEDVRRQVSSMAGPLPTKALEAILGHAGGNPLLVSATLHGMVEVGALRSEPDGWKLVPQRLTDLQTAERVAPLLMLRLASLSERPRRLLSVAAILGRTFDPVLAGALAGVEARDAMQIAEDVRGRLVWAVGSGTSFGFVHDKIREGLLESLSEDERKVLHRRAAELIHASDPDRIYDLAYHFDASGDPVRALPFALAAAERARNQFALDLAERYYRTAARGATTTRTKLTVEQGLGDVLALRSRYEDAVRHYHSALDLARTNRERAEVEQHWSQLEMKRGDMGAACQHAEDALRLLGHRVPRNRIVLTAWTLWEGLVQVFHTLLPATFVHPRKRKANDDELFAIDIYHGLNGPYFFSREVMWAGWAHLRLINLAERFPGTRALGRAYAAHAVCLNAFPRLFPRGLRLSRAGADLCEHLGDPWGQAQGLTFHAMMLYYTGRFDEAVQVGRRASRIFDRTGDRWEANSGLDFAVDALVRMGDLGGAIRQAREIWRRGLEIGDSHALAWSLDAWSRASDGRIDPEQVELARARARDLQTALAVAQADGVRLIGAGKLAEAVQVLDAARRRNMSEAGYFYELNTPLLTYLTTALRMQAEQVSPWAPDERCRLVERAKRVGEQALAVARKFRLNLPHALRESAFLSAMSAKSSLARKQIDESIAVATELGEHYERAQSRLARAQLGCALGWEVAQGEMVRARQEVEAFRDSARQATESSKSEAATEEVTLSLVDRFATVLDDGRAIATALSRDEVYARVRRAALLLLRSERCVVLVRAPAIAELTPVHGDVGVPYSRQIVRRALEAGRTIALSTAEVQRDATSQRSGARSILCIPIRVRGEAHACLYLTHAEVDDLFGESERRIGDFLGTLAGAALENADGFARLEALSRELERRVDERTRQLALANADLEESLRRIEDTHEQLVQSSKMAALGTMLAGLSHEINNPLAAILGYVQVLLRQTPEDSPARRPLLAMERQTLRCSRLTQSLLSISRTKPASRERTDPGPLCSAVVELVAADASARDIEVRRELPADPLPDIMISAPEIESALLNLLSNALDATPEGGTVVLAARTETREHVPGVRFSISDTGHGIPSEVQPRIFDPFYTTKPPGRGTGLGLALVHQAAAAHGGSVDVESHEGRGSTLSIWLPTSDDASERSSLPS